jgi:23S rRNA (adenine-N6)-dimethyltransferase
VVHGDFLHARPPREPFAVVGNIPYSRTSDIVSWCLRAPALTSATLVTQLEYARKRTGGYGRWTLRTVASWPEYEWRLLGRVARREFVPVPATDSAVVRLDHRPVPLLSRQFLAAYRDFVTHAFSGVGGSAHAALGRRYRAHAVRSAFRRHGIDPALPCGLLTPGQWLALFGELHRVPVTGRGSGG